MIKSRAIYLFFQPAFQIINSSFLLIRAWWIGIHNISISVYHHICWEMFNPEAALKHTLLLIGQSVLHHILACKRVAFNHIFPTFFGRIIGKIHENNVFTCELFFNVGNVCHLHFTGSAPCTPEIDVYDFSFIRGD